MTAKELKEARLRWDDLCKRIQTATEVTIQDRIEQKRRQERAKKDYNYFVMTYFPHYATCPCAKFHIQAANEIKNSPTLRAAYMWPRGHAKSTHMDVFVPLWLKIQGLLHVMVLVGKSEDNANILLSDLQAELISNQLYIADFGEQYSQGSWEAGNFVTCDGTAFFARGRGQSPRGLRYRNCRPDYIVIDDVDDDELCESPSRVRKLSDWVKSALFGAMDSGRGRFIIVGNLISKNSVLQKISENKSVSLSKIEAITKSGLPAWPQKNTMEELRQMETFMGYRAFQREMMNNPITEGAIFKNSWIRFGKTLPLKRYDYLVCYIDPSWKESTKNDYKAAKLWGKKGTQLHHMKAFVRQCSIVEMVRWLYDLYESLPENVICTFLIEANFLQDMILDEFTTEGEIRGYQLPISPDTRSKPNKFQRIEAVSPLWERGFVLYNEIEKDDPDMKVGIEQTLAFEKGSRAHDDGPDADEGAIYYLQQQGRINEIKPLFGRVITDQTW